VPFIPGPEDEEKEWAEAVIRRCLLALPSILVCGVEQVDLAVAALTALGVKWLKGTSYWCSSGCCCWPGFLDFNWGESAAKVDVRVSAEESKVFPLAKADTFSYLKGSFLRRFRVRIRLSSPAIVDVDQSGLDLFSAVGQPGFHLFGRLLVLAARRRRAIICKNVLGLNAKGSVSSLNGPC